ncbi:MAG: hypothetical protein EAZ33_24205, partial [Oscillatoriales cyanobacterium]
VLDQALTLKALQTIASRLNDMERKEVAMWAQAQALIMYRDGKPENLCGDKYLQVELPCFDVPSLLGLWINERYIRSPCEPFLQGIDGSQ